MVHTWVTAAAGSTASVHKTKVSAKRQFSRSTGPIRNWRMARSFFFIIAFLILFSGFTIMRTFAANEEVPPRAAEEIVISVDSGDTLWQLAAAYKSESVDTREAVHALMKRNGLSSSSLEMGQTLIIPARILP
ncbi:cell division suppressor protein YneA [Cohnella kolymensis]|uniref:cell division suppressor protein YneA n=1 Tax=Cohnella kolymensis TaxID=1590652 RepID=UPI000697C861|nr:LysM peptidoglycan-binding domain-containing protein [Cohnella kolymensis]